MIKGIEHVAIFAKDKNKLISWYKDVFGFESVIYNGKETSFVKAPGGMMIEFLNAEANRPSMPEKTQGMGHIAFSVTNFDEVVAAIKEKGIDIDLKQSLTEEKKMVFFPDPEGNTIQLVYRKVPLV